MNEGTKQILEQRLEKVAEAFALVQNEISYIESQEQQLLQKKGGLNVEMFRLQGEHRVLKELLNPEEKDSVPDEVTAI